MEGEEFMLWVKRIEEIEEDNILRFYNDGYDQLHEKKQMDWAKFLQSIIMSNDFVKHFSLEVCLQQLQSNLLYKV